MTLVSLDRAAVRADLLSLVSESRRLAPLLRLPMTRPMGDEQRAKARIARRITELLVLLAYARGKLHVVTRPRAFPLDVPFDPIVHAETIAEKTAALYVVPTNEGATARVGAL